MHKIRTYNAISEKINNILNEEEFEVVNSGEPHGIIVRSYNLHNENFGKDILAIARAGAGYNNIPVEKCTDEGIVVFNTPGANANAVRELTICAIIMASRNVLECIEWTGKLSGVDIPKQAEKGKSQFVGNEVKGKTLGILGLGATGALVADVAVSMGMKVVGYDPHLNISNAWKLNNHVLPVSEDELIKTSDFISIHAPLTDETTGKYSRDFISKTKKGVVLLNFSRAEVANEDDIKAAINSGHVKKYVVDFPTQGLLNVPNVIVMPHIASGSFEAEDNCAVMAARELRDYLKDGNIANSVNYPNCLKVIVLF